MYKNLSHKGLGISGRQSELIELALTYGFRGFDLDMDHFAKQAELKGVEHARRFIDSANIKIGCFDLPTRWQADDATFQDDLTALKAVADVAASIGAVSCRTVVMPACDQRPYHENFEFHRQRLGAVADVLAGNEIYLGLDFLPLVLAGAHEEREFQFIGDPEALLTLIDTIGASNLGLALDLWNWRVGGGTLDKLKELPAHAIVEVRMSDIPADADLASIQEDQRMLPSEDGLVGCAAVLKMLAEMGYVGPITPFPGPYPFVGMTRDNIVRQASRSIDEQWAAAGLTKEGTLADTVDAVDA